MPFLGSDTLLKNQNNNPSVMLGTLGVEPQVITLALDCLLQQNINISEVTVIYTDNTFVKKAWENIKKEFSTGIYSKIALRSVLIQDLYGPLQDFYSEEDLKSLLKAIFKEMRWNRENGKPTHLCISGGRKVMSVFAVVAAQLLFGPADRAWYLMTEGWYPGGERKMHADGADSVRLIRVPVLGWKESKNIVHTVAEMEDPLEVVKWHEESLQEIQLKRKEEFLNHWLTNAEREIVSLVCQGIDNAAIAKRLNKQEQTVANQMRGVYEKLREWMDYPPQNVDRSSLIAQFAPYYNFKNR